ncbi:hypothetical protein BDZ97DRAFT_1019970 [Flammula alnicola]|nr:hypothetical protein BDZ97DRAFT_1019970 [Flammula alnicola]
MTSQHGQQTTLSRLEFQGFKASVKMDGKELECYASQINTDKKEVSCWITSEAGKAFSVYLEAHRLDFDCRAHLHFDGHRIDGVIFIRRKHGSRENWDHIVTDDNRKRFFIFSPMDFTDDANIGSILSGASAGSSVRQKVGEIEIIIFRLSNVKKVSALRKTWTAPQVHKIPESVAKGRIMHQVVYKEESAIEQPAQAPTPEVFYTGNRGDRVATFIFRYRPRDVLQRTGILPRDLTPQPPEIQPEEVPPSPPLHSSSTPVLSGPVKRKASSKQVKYEQEDNKEHQMLLDDDEDFERRETALLNSS